MKSSNRGLLEDHLHRLYGYAYSLCRDREEAKDLVQECAVKALSARNIPSDASAYRAWLFKILRNAFFDRRRRQENRENFAQSQAQQTSFMEYWDYDDRLINVITIKSELSRLDTAHREIIGLIDFGGLSYREAADTLSVPVGTVMSRISRARAALLRAISEGNVHAFPIKRRS